MKNRYQVSDEFKNSCKANVGLNRYGRIHIIEDNIDIEGEHAGGQLVDFTIEDNCYVNDTFVGTTVAKKITVNILNPDNQINLENKTIQAYVGIYINGKLEEIPYGTYIIEKPTNEEVKQKTSFTGYDNMIKFNKLYENKVSYPIKLSELFINVCNQVGLEVGNTDFINADYMVLGNPFTNNEDCRTVLSNIAQLAGTFAKIGRDNKVYIPTLKNASNLLTVKYVNAMTVKELNLTQVKVLSGEADSAEEQLDGMNYLEDFSKNDQWGGLNSFVIAVSDIEGENTALDDKDDIAKNGLSEITIQDNYFLIEQAEREKVIVPLWNMLKGLKYLPFKTEYYGYPYLDTGDMIYIQDTKDNGYVSYVFNHTFTFNGAFKGTLETQAMTKTQTAYKNTFDVKSKFRRVERLVDKINGRIEDVIEEQTETSNKLSQHEQTIDGIKDTVSSVETKLENDYTKTEEMNSIIDQKADSITSSVSKSITTAKQEAIDSANASTDKKLKDYPTTEQMNSKITQTAQDITSEVNKKVGNDEFGTKLQQDWQSIQIAWNKISNFIQFINAQLQIKDSNKNLLMALTQYGLRLYESGTLLGLIGTNKLHGYPTKKGLDFDLDMAGSYMTWASRSSSSSDTYTMKLTYARANTGTFEDDGLYLGTDFFLGDWTMYWGANKDIAISGNAIVDTINNETILRFGTDGYMHAYDSINMHGWNIDNAGNVVITESTVGRLDLVQSSDQSSGYYLRIISRGGTNFGVTIWASDGRLKKNIQETSVTALDLIKQIKHRQFDWKETNKHEDIGYIAQELKEVKEDFVLEVEQEDGSNISQINETKIIPVLSKAIQEQQEQIEKQQKEIDELKGLVNMLLKANNMEVQSSNKLKANATTETPSIDETVNYGDLTINVKKEAEKEVQKVEHKKGVEVKFYKDEEATNNE